MAATAAVAAVVVVSAVLLQAARSKAKPAATVVIRLTGESYVVEEDVAAWDELTASLDERSSWFQPGGVTSRHDLLSLSSLPRHRQPDIQTPPGTNLAHRKCQEPTPTRAKPLATPGRTAMGEKV